MPFRIWPIGLYRVSGESMLPGYAPGDVLLGLHWFRPRPGQVVVALHSGKHLIKRLIRVDPDGIWLEGDNAAHSTDSRHYGLLRKNQLRAKIIAKL